jgi:small-conductance mechanosensitive channel
MRSLVELPLGRAIEREDEQQLESVIQNLAKEVERLKDWRSLLGVTDTELLTQERTRLLTDPEVRSLTLQYQQAVQKLLRIPEYEFRYREEQDALVKNLKDQLDGLVKRRMRPLEVLRGTTQDS